MHFGSVSVRRVGVALCAGLIGVTAILASTGEAEAARRKVRKKPRAAAVGQVYAPPFSAMVVDVNSGRTMYSVAPDELRHPASVTKVMTLYLLFEQLERGNLSLDSELKVSAHSAAQAPSKLGLRPGQTIEVEDAIKALVTKSANDVAATIAENISGSEEEFAERMTRKARQLGMTNTVYRNASGLPNREQVTTARDLTILGRAIQERFPKYYRYFQTRSFAFQGRVIGNHNRLLGKVEGVDGIKTGFTNASGFNLMTSAKLDGRHVVGVVLGGRSAASRDATMTNLIRTNLAKASVGGGTSVFADASARRAARQADEDVETTATTAAVPALPPAKVASAMLAPLKLASANAASTAASAPAVYASADPSDLPPARPSAAQKLDARLPPMQIAPPAPPSRSEAMVATPPIREASRAVEAPRPAAEPKRAEIAKVSPSISASVTPWVIQLAAEADEDKARDLLDQAKKNSGRALKGAAPFTEKVVRGGTTLYRARFSGFQEADTAAEVCKSLKRNGFACFVTRS